MKARLLSLFNGLAGCLSADNARAVARARQVVLANEITTYDDYAEAMAEANSGRLPPTGRMPVRAIRGRARL